MYKQTDRVCRACGSTDLVEVFNFGKAMPLANDWCQPDGSRKGFVPLRVLFASNAPSRNLARRLTRRFYTGNTLRDQQE